MTSQRRILGEKKLHISFGVTVSRERSCFRPSDYLPGRDTVKLLAISDMFEL
jgi:hypothetical protein